MPVKPNFNPDFLYFITANAVDHLCLFQTVEAKQVLLDCLNFMRENNRMKLHAFVLMPNHLHLISGFPGPDTLSAVIRDFKKFTSRQIRKILESAGDAELAIRCQLAGLEAKQNFKVWADGFDARDLFSSRFIQQKLDYIHNNPCQPQWGLAQNPEDYPWSSARFYLRDEPAIIPIDDLRDIL